MSLILGLVLHTLDQVNHVSRHSMLMRFYALDIEIEYSYNARSYEENFHDINLYFKEIEARAILKVLDIL